MFYKPFKTVIILTSLFFSFFYINTQAQTFIITTPVPVAKEVIVVPQGYTKCFMTRAGWRYGEWVPSHRVCQYTSSPKRVYQGTAWVDGHWACTRHKRGICSRWKWKSGHWVKTMDGYY